MGLAALAGGAPLLHPASAPPAENASATATPKPDAAARPSFYDPFDPKAGLPPPTKPPNTPPPSPQAPPVVTNSPAKPRYPPPFWPGGSQVTVTVALKTFPNGAGKNAYYRPYLALWVEDANHALVRTIVVLGRDSTYLRHLTSWWRVSGSYTESTYIAMTRATRPAGEHTFVWDGYNDAGNPLPKGRYTLFIEICRENGRHTLQSVPLEIGDDTLSLPLPADVESNPGKVEYGPPKKSSPPPAP